MSLGRSIGALIVYATARVIPPDVSQVEPVPDLVSCLLSPIKRGCRRTHRAEVQG
jgi:hypothetical protein